jgi:hypothetical protein
MNYDLPKKYSMRWAPELGAFFMLLFLKKDCLEFLVILLVSHKFWLEICLRRWLDVGVTHFTAILSGGVLQRVMRKLFVVDV